MIWVYTNSDIATEFGENSDRNRGLDFPQSGNCMREPCFGCLFAGRVARC